MTVKDIASAARNLAEYIDKAGEQVNLPLVKIQVELIQNRLNILTESEHGVGYPAELEFQAGTGKQRETT